MPTVEILNSHPISFLRKEISKTNIKGYSKMKKKELIELMMKNKDRFHHIAKKEASVKVKVAPKTKSLAPKTKPPDFPDVPKKVKGKKK